MKKLLLALCVVPLLSGCATLGLLTGGGASVEHTCDIALRASATVTDIATVLEQHGFKPELAQAIAVDAATSTDSITYVCAAIKAHQAGLDPVQPEPTVQNVGERG